VARRPESIAVSLFYWSLRRLLELLVLRRRSEREKEIEILLLRHQLQVLERQVARPQLTQADRALLTASLRAGQMHGCGGEQRPVFHPELRSRDLPAQDRELMPQDQQLDVFHVQAAAATNKRAQQSPNGEIDEGEGHAADPPNVLASTLRHRYWRPSRRVLPPGKAVDWWDEGAFVDDGFYYPIEEVRPTMAWRS
jgi:hypothetical protein